MENEIEVPEQRQYHINTILKLILAQNGKKCQKFPYTNVL
jgi:hypothetical protein